MVCVIILFGRGAFSIVEVDRSEGSGSVFLIKDSGDRKATCIGLENDRLCRVEMLDDRCSGEGPLQLLKCEFGLTSPFPFLSRLI